MVIAGDAPTFGVGQVFIRNTVFVGVSQASDFAALAGVQIAVIVGEPEGLVQTGGELHKVARYMIV